MPWIVFWPVVSADTPILTCVVPGVVVLEYDPSWPQLFARAASELRLALGETVTDIQHVGGTAVPGLAARPIIDVLAIAPCLAALDARRGRLLSFDYTAHGDVDVAGHLYFTKGKERPAGGLSPHQVHLHAYSPGHSDALQQLLVRDYLRNNPQARDSYGRQKQQLATRPPAATTPANVAYVKGKQKLLANFIARATGRR